MPTPRSALLVPAALLLSLVGCASPETPHSSPHDPGSAWTYIGDGGPERWGDLAEEYTACSSGRAQSPIDLPAPRRGTPLDLTGSGSVPGLTADNGHTVQFTADDGATTRIAGEDLHLAQVHFHAGSEHTVRGKASAAEFHFVHADARGDLTVVGVLAERGQYNPAYEGFVAGATSGAGRTSSVDVEAMLPEARSFATYEGSLTTPPCTEGVRWIVLEDPVELGADQIAELEAAHVGNARPPQPLGDRTVRHTL